MPTIILLPTFQGRNQGRGDKMEKHKACTEVKVKFIKRVIVSDVLTIAAMCLVILHLLGVV
jgi:hypothetical protein